MTPSKTPFSGQEVLAPGDPLSSDGYYFQARNPLIIDRLLRIGATTHRHDEHAAMADPTVAPVVAVDPTSGAIPSDTPIFVTYTLLDADGGETLPAGVVQVTTPTGYLAPTGAPDVEADYALGSLLAGDFSYALTITDGRGGESMIGPASVVTIEPGHATARVMLSGLAAIVSEASGGASGAGWRLWRSQGGGPWYLLASDASDTFTDDGVIGDCTIAPPLIGTTVGTNALQITVPDESVTGTTLFSIYASIDGTFTGACRLGTYAASELTVVKVYTELAFLDGSPPVVSTSYPGAHKIFPDSELMWGLKSPVATFTDLPPGVKGDMRIVIDKKRIYSVLSPVAVVPEDWTFLASSTWLDPVATYADLPTDVPPGAIALTLDTDQVWLFKLTAPANNPNWLRAPFGSYPIGDPPDYFNGNPTGIDGLIAVDDYLYFVMVPEGGDNPHPDSQGTIGRVKFDGTEAPNFSFITDTFVARSLTFSDTHIYWVEGGLGGPHGGGTWISRANRDGTGVERGWLNYAGGLGGFYGANGVRVSGDRLYISVWGTVEGVAGVVPGPALLSFDLEGGDPQTVIDFTAVGSPEPGMPGPTLVDDFICDDTHVYWTGIASQSWYGVIGRANLDGSGVENPWVTLSTGDSGPGSNDDRAFDMVISDGFLYYGGGMITLPGDTDLRAHATIGRIDLTDGTHTSWWKPVWPMLPEWGRSAPDHIRSLAVKDGVFYYAGAVAGDAGFPPMAGAPRMAPVVGRVAPVDSMTWVPLFGREPTGGPPAVGYGWTPVGSPGPGADADFADAGGGAAFAVSGGLLTTNDSSQVLLPDPPVVPRSFGVATTAEVAAFVAPGGNEIGDRLELNPTMIAITDPDEYRWDGSAWQPVMVYVGPLPADPDAIGLAENWSIPFVPSTLRSPANLYVAQWTEPGAHGVNARLRAKFTGLDMLFTAPGTFGFVGLGVCMNLVDADHGLTFYVQGGKIGWTLRPRDLLQSGSYVTPARLQADGSYTMEGEHPLGGRQMRTLKQGVTQAGAEWMDIHGGGGYLGMDLATLVGNLVTIDLWRVGNIAHAVIYGNGEPDTPGGAGFSYEATLDLTGLTDYEDGTTGYFGIVAPYLVPGAGAAAMAVTEWGAIPVAYTLQGSDAATCVEISSETTSHVTVPPNGAVYFDAGTVIEVRKTGGGDVSIIAGDGVTLHVLGTNPIVTRYGTLRLHQRALNEWVVTNA